MVSTAAVIAAAIVVVLLVVWFADRERFSTRAATPVRSRVDGAAYRVHARHHDPEGAADRIARTKDAWIVLLRRLRAKYAPGGGSPRGGDVSPARAAVVRRLLARYDPTAYVENSPRSKDGETSYTTAKGRLVAMCLREDTPGADGRHDFEDAALLFYVHLHEMAHIGTDSWGHETEFWQTFAFLLEEAVAAGVYTPRDFLRRPVTYCGLKIEYCPLYDPGLAPL